MNTKINPALRIGTPLLFWVWLALPAFPQTPPAPSVTPLRSYKGLIHSPGGMAVDSAGRLYIADPPAGRVFVRDMYGRLVNVKDGLQNPLSVAIGPFGNIYVAEEGAGRVTRFDPTWNPIGALGPGTDGYGTNEFQMPNHIAIDPGIGTVYVTDSRANYVRIYSADGTRTGTFGGPGTLPGQFAFPTGIFVSPTGEVFVGDENNKSQIQVFGLDGTYRRTVLKGGMIGPKLGRIQGITGDAAGRIYIVDTFQGYVQVTDATGSNISRIGSFGESLGQLQTPTGLAIDTFNRLFVGSIGNTRIEVFGLDSYSDPSILPALIDFRPTRTDQKTLSAYLEVPGVAPDQIVVSSVTANGVPALPKGSAIVDYDLDGILELQVKFDVSALLATLPNGEALVNVDGQLLDGRPFEGSAFLTVLVK